MKVALVHDYIKEYGGAERVLEVFHEVFPDAPIFTSVYCPEYLGPHQSRFKEMQIRTSFLQILPFKEKFISLFRIISPLVFGSFNLKNFDVVIVSQTGAYLPNYVAKQDAKLICYTHTPPRYLYGYKTAREWKNNVFFLLLGETMNHFLRLLDFKAAQNVDQFIANSEEIRLRIKKFYRKEAVVVNPPVEISHQLPLLDQKKIEDYYLAGGRFARAKGMDVIVEAFNQNGKSLKVFGRGFAGYEEELKKKAKKNIEFVGEVSDEKKLTLMAGATAFVFASYDEDFGITPVEAMSVGTPVIAFKSGGVKETVIDGKTGVFFDENNPEKLNEAIAGFKELKLKPEDCVSQAEKFAKVLFIKEIKKVVSNQLHS